MKNAQSETTYFESMQEIIQKQLPFCGKGAQLRWQIPIDLLEAEIKLLKEYLESGHALK